MNSDNLDGVAFKSITTPHYNHAFNTKRDCLWFINP